MPPFMRPSDLFPARKSETSPTAVVSQLRDAYERRNNVLDNLITERIDPAGKINNRTRYITLINAIESLAKALRQRARVEAEGDVMLDSLEHAQYRLPPGSDPHLRRAFRQEGLSRLTDSFVEAAYAPSPVPPHHNLADLMKEEVPEQFRPGSRKRFPSPSRSVLSDPHYPQIKIEYGDGEEENPKASQPKRRMR